MQEVETVTAIVDLDEVRSYRAAKASLQEQASSALRIPCIAVDFSLSDQTTTFLPMELSTEIPIRRCVTTAQSYPSPRES
jgi:hypothetical protein